MFTEETLNDILLKIIETFQKRLLQTREDAAQRTTRVNINARSNAGLQFITAVDEII